MDRHDNTGNLANGRERRFMDKFPEEVLNMQRKMIEYMKQVIRPASDPNPMQTTEGEVRRPDLDIKMVDGFPFIPPLLPNIHQNKDDLEKLLRRYLNAHYSE
jgi:hypothetical protein